MGILARTHDWNHDRDDLEQFWANGHLSNWEENNCNAKKILHLFKKRKRKERLFQRTTKTNLSTKKVLKALAVTWPDSENKGGNTKTQMYPENSFWQLEAINDNNKRFWEIFVSKEKDFWREWDSVWWLSHLYSGIAITIWR